MSEGTDAALKEWAIICRALADGRQTLLIRKGGILEVKNGFEVAHRSFWLFPTYVHQKLTDLVPSVREEFQAVHAAQPSPGILPLQLFATVTDAIQVTHLECLRRLENHHLLSWECVNSRFHYRNKPGVHVLVVRIQRRPDPVVLQNKPWYDGCVSWVELDRAISADGCVPVLSDAEFEVRRASIRTALESADSRV
jgi:hypothetical protein